MNQFETSVSENDRVIGKKALGNILSIEKNITILEKNIYQVTSNQEEYIELCMDTVSKIKNGTKLNTLLSQIKSGNFGFNSSHFASYKQELDEQHNFIENPFEVDEGVLECTKCGSRKTISFSKQTRGGDEGTTVFAKCVTCGKTWKT